MRQLFTLMLLGMAFSLSASTITIDIDLNSSPHNSNTFSEEATSLLTSEQAVSSSLFLVFGNSAACAAWAESVCDYGGIDVGTVEGLAVWTALWQACTAITTEDEA